MKKLLLCSMLVVSVVLAASIAFAFGGFVTSFSEASGGVLAVSANFGTTTTVQTNNPANTTITGVPTFQISTGNDFAKIFGNKVEFNAIGGNGTFTSLDAALATGQAKSFGFGSHSSVHLFGKAGGAIAVGSAY
jgi:ABC-type glycerol-3-phosphate transport system substrate-binding protein